MKMDYEKLEAVTVRSQEELDEIPEGFKGSIYVEFGTWENRAVVSKRYLRQVVARGSSSVVARGNSSVEARGSSSVVAWGNSSVEARENSSVVARENSSVVARENSSVVARENSSVVAWGNSSVEARENSSVEAWGSSSVEAWGSSSVEAWGSSSVEAWGHNSKINACGNVQVVDCLNGAKIKISGNARKVNYRPSNKDIFEFMDFYGIRHTKTKATFYKAVKKIGDRYVSNYNNDFEYIVGKFKIEECDKNASKGCSFGIHVSSVNWALDFGKNWKNLAILELEVKVVDIILPENSDGEVRANKVKVLREIPLEECGVYGKILAKRNYL